MKKWVVMLLLGLSFSSPLWSFDLTSFRLVQKALPSQEQDTGESYMNFLAFPSLAKPIPLARSQVLRDDNGEKVTIGFSPDSLKLEWLIPSQLLWISWTTYSQGTGGFNFDGNLLLNIRYDTWKELFRDFFLSYARGGWWHSNSNDLSFSYNPRLNLLTLVTEKVDYFAEEEKPDLFSSLEINRNGEKPLYEYLWKEKFVRSYSWLGNNLEYLSGYRMTYLDKKGFSPKKLASELKIPLQDLKKMNPLLKGKKTWKEWVVTDSALAPYASDVSNDGLTGGL